LPLGAAHDIGHCAFGVSTPILPGFQLQRTRPMPSFTARRTRAVACAVLSVFLASCGGSDDDVAPPAPPADPGAPVFITLSNFQAAAVVVGQPNFQSTDDNQGIGPNANTLWFPTSVAMAPDGRMFVVDSENFRILGFDSVPTTNGSQANFVLGQPGFQSGDPPATTDASTIRSPLDMSFGAGKTAVADTDANRVLIYNGIPAAGASAAWVVGQPNLGASGASCTASGMDAPTAAVLTPDGKLIVADAANHRVLIWTQIPAANGVAADIILGQPNGQTCVQNDDPLTGEASAGTFHFPTGIWSDGTRLAVADSLNHRVLIWNTFPTTTQQPADHVLGQVNFTNVNANDSDGNGVAGPGPTASTLASPSGPKAVAFNGYQFAVADFGNSRVLVWNGFPTANGQPADIVLGQKNAQTNAPNDADGNGTTDAGSAQTLSSPVGVTFWARKMLVTDQNNHRVLVFESQ
jgi:hypothetical protein